jgi:hypothetical protein
VPSRSRASNETLSRSLPHVDVNYTLDEQTLCVHLNTHDLIFEMGFGSNRVPWRESKAAKDVHVTVTIVLWESDTSVVHGIKAI